MWTAVQVEEWGAAGGKKGLCRSLTARMQVDTQVAGNCVAAAHFQRRSRVVQPHSIAQRSPSQGSQLKR